MRLIFQQGINYGFLLSVCMGWSVMVQGEIYHFSADALIMLQQQKKQEAYSSTNIHTSIHPFSPAACSNVPSLLQCAQAHQDTKLSEKTNRKRTTQQLYSSINTIACIYALIRITYCYHGYFIADIPPQAWYDHLIPIRSLSLVKKIRFGVASTLILGETLLGKSLAKLAILCATGDITDLIEAALIRIKKIMVG